MLDGNDIDRARAALYSIPADLQREKWLRALMGAHSAGVSEKDVEEWSATAHNYKAAEFRATWRSIKSGKGIGAGTLFAIAREHGYVDRMRPQSSPKPIARPIEAPTKLRPGMSAADVWERCEKATNTHPYIILMSGAFATYLAYWRDRTPVIVETQQTPQTPSCAWPAIACSPADPSWAFSGSPDVAAQNLAPRCASDPGMRMRRSC